jgi:hypothetical protein
MSLDCRCLLCFLPILCAGCHDVAPLPVGLYGGFIAGACAGYY